MCCFWNWAHPVILQEVLCCGVSPCFLFSLIEYSSIRALLVDAVFCTFYEVICCNERAVFIIMTRLAMSHRTVKRCSWQVTWCWF